MAAFCLSHAVVSRKFLNSRSCPHRPRACAALPSNEAHPTVLAVPPVPQGNNFPASIPQTIEWALAQAQKALAEALIDDVRRIVIELPMGRARKYWYQLSPRASWMRETGILASHIANAVRGADVRVVLAESCGSNSCSDAWISRRDMLCSASQEDFLGATGESTILFVVGVPNRHETHLKRILEKVPDSVPVVLFNCLMDAPIERNVFPQDFVPTYMCRAMKRCAFAKYGHRAPYTLYVEIAVFEYEWIADVSDKENFVPTQMAIERAAYARGAHPGGAHGFYKSHHRGCEAGFWPFMSLAAKYMLPLRGESYRKDSDSRLNQKRKPSTSSKPFGFF